jgi:hypothetical protein
MHREGYIKKSESIISLYSHQGALLFHLPESLMQQVIFYRNLIMGERFI